MHERKASLERKKYENCENKQYMCTLEEILKKQTKKYYEKWKKHGMKDTDKARNKEKEKESGRNKMETQKETRVLANKL